MSVEANPDTTTNPVVITYTHPTDQVLQRAQECFSGVRQRIAEGMEYLYIIQADKLWDNGQYSSFGEYVEQGLGISEGMASKLIKTYKHYILNGSLSQRNLEGVDAEKAYLAISLPGTPEEQLIKAETLTRREIKEQLVEETHGPHEHILGPERWGKCTVCGLFHLA